MNSENRSDIEARYQLLGAEVSYYSGKARAYLRAKRIPFDEVLATREVYTEQILPRVGWPVIPVVITPEGKTLQDTTLIIDALESRFPEPSMVPRGGLQQLVAHLLEAYGDEWLKLPAMHYRWNHCYEWILTEFGRMSRPDLPPEQQLEVGRKNAGRFHGSLPFLGVHTETQPAIEQSYEQFLTDFNDHLEQHPYLLGDRPSIADFGFYGPLYAHLYRDPYPGDLMRRLAPNVSGWVERLRDGDVSQPTLDDTSTVDRLPESLAPLLKRWSDEYVPVLRETARQMSEWVRVNSDHSRAPLPRSIGTQEFTLLRHQDGEVTAQRAVFPYDLWMLQRARDHFSALPGTDTAACRDLLTSLDAFDLMTMEIPRLEIREFRLYTV